MQAQEANWQPAGLHVAGPAGLGEKWHLVPVRATVPGMASSAGHYRPFASGLTTAREPFWTSTWSSTQGSLRGWPVSGHWCRLSDSVPGLNGKQPPRPSTPFTRNNQGPWRHHLNPIRTLPCSRLNKPKRLDTSLPRHWRIFAVAYRTALCGICGPGCRPPGGQKWRELDDVFWTVIPFGTGGRRGRMYPIGTNAINDRTIGESAQGLAHYVLQWRTAHGTSCQGTI